MKKGFRCAALSLIFVLTGLLMFGKISNILRKKTGAASDMIHSFYELEKNSLDVLCMGSSHGYSSFQPNILWSEQGMTSYVMCSPRQTAASTYYLLQEALCTQKPKVLLLETYYFFTGKKYADEESLRMAFDGVKLGKAKHEMISDLLAKKGWKKKLSYYIPFLKYHGRWDELENNDFHSKTYLKGSIFDFTVYKMEEPTLVENTQKLPKNVRYYLEKILQLCEEQGIELILYTAPYSYQDRKAEDFDQKQGMNIAVKEYCEEHDIPYFDFQRSIDAGIDYAQDFRDYAHMNTRGAEKITRYLGQYLKQNGTYPDHRGDEAFASWERDYEKYAAEAAKKRK